MQLLLIAKDRPIERSDTLDEIPEDSFVWIDATRSEAAEPCIPTRRTKVPRGQDLDHTGAVAGAAIFSFSSLQVLRTSAVISEQSSI